MRIDPVKVEFFNYLRSRIIEKWNPVDYIGFRLTASGLKELMKSTLANGNDHKKSIILDFLGVASINSITELGLMNKSKCIENFFLGRTKVTSENTRRFIVNFFEIEMGTLDEFKRQGCNGKARNYICSSINADGTFRIGSPKVNAERTASSLPLILFFEYRLYSLSLSLFDSCSA